MAQELDDGEFWLPPQFLTDDDILMDFKEQQQQPSRGSADKVFGFENGAGFWLFQPNSDLSSPGESVNGSTETESDEEDFLAGLTRKMANSTLNDDMWKIHNKKSWGMATSPQSTLCNVMGTCSCKQGSSRGSPTCPSPPVAGGTNHSSGGAWDLLYAAAGEVERMKMAEQVHVSGFNNNRGFLAAPRKPAPISVPIKTQNPNLGFHSGNQPLPYQQLQAVQFHHLKQQQMFKQQQHYQQGHHHHQQVIQNRARNGPNNNKPLDLSMSAWPTLQQYQQPQGQGQPQQSQSQSQPQPQPQPPGSGMRAVYLGNPGAKRECTGTGVFLPRQIGTQPESRKKRGGCSTVLLPDRVVQALNLNLDAMEAPPQSQPRIHSLDYADLRYRSALMAQQQQRRTIRHIRQQPGPIENNELRLPQEWTY